MFNPPRFLPDYDNVLLGHVDPRARLPRRAPGDGAQPERGAAGNAARGWVRRGNVRLESEAGWARLLIDPLEDVSAHAEDIVTEGSRPARTGRRRRRTDRGGARVRLLATLSS
ncbi:MAG: hypothetical protein M3070_04120 [Actinomycetota bacterium]|nr:hypothetical protein [Actinomycetota bacterium]